MVPTLPTIIITTFIDLSTRFAQAYALKIQELKQTDSLFKVVKHSQESFQQFVDQFKATLKLVANPYQFMAFVKELMHDPTVHTHSLLINLVIGCIEKYQNA